MKASDKQRLDELTSALADELKNISPDIIQVLEKWGMNPRDVVSFMVLAKPIKVARTSRYLSIKDVGREIKAPQYKIKYIEECSISSISMPILQKYIAFLGLDDTFREWCREFPEVVQRIENTLT